MATYKLNTLLTLFPILYLKTYNISCYWQVSKHQCFTRKIRWRRSFLVSERNKIRHRKIQIKLTCFWNRTKYATNFSNKTYLLLWYQLLYWRENILVFVGEAVWLCTHEYTAFDANLQKNKVVFINDISHFLLVSTSLPLLNLLIFFVHCLVLEVYAKS